MYIIINNTTKETIGYEGDYPEDYLLKLLLRGDDVLVISMYSNTIKVLKLEKEIHGEDYYVESSAEYPLPIEYIELYLKGE